MLKTRMFLTAAFAIAFAAISIFSMPAEAQKKSNSSVSKPSPNKTTGSQPKGVSGLDLGSSRRK